MFSAPAKLELSQADGAVRTGQTTDGEPRRAFISSISFKLNRNPSVLRGPSRARGATPIFHRFRCFRFHVWNCGSSSGVCARDATPRRATSRNATPRLSVDMTYGHGDGDGDGWNGAIWWCRCVLSETKGRCDEMEWSGSAWWSGATPHRAPKVRRLDSVSGLRWSGILFGGPVSTGFCRGLCLSRHRTRYGMPPKSLVGNVVRLLSCREVV